MEPHVLGDGKRIVLSMVPQRVELLGFKSFETGRAADGTIGTIGTTEQPEFATARVTADVSLGNGQHRLIAVHSLASGELELFIAHASATRVNAD